MTIKLKGSTDGSVSLQAPADTSPTGDDITLTLPTTAGSANEFVKMTDGSGTLGYSDMVETSTGIGIGTSSPASKVHIVDTLAGGQLLVSSAQSASDIEKYGTFGTEHYNADEEPALGIAVQSSSTGNTVLIGGSLGEFNAASYIRLYTAANNTTTTGTERVTIDSSGQVFVNCTSSPTSNATGIVNAVSTSTGDMINLKHVKDGNNSINIWQTGTTSYTAISFNKGNTQTVVGGIQCTTTSTTYNTSSDYRLKENVVDISDGITRVKQLQPKRFNFIIEPNQTVDGFLAHEAQTVVPEAVTGTHNEVDDDGNAVMQGIDQSKLVPLLTAALQEAIAKIETLETKVAALEAGS